MLQLGVNIIITHVPIDREWSLKGTCSTLGVTQVLAYPIVHPYLSPKHLVGRDTQTPPVHCIGIACTGWVKYLRCCVCVCVCVCVSGREL